MAVKARIYLDGEEVDLRDFGDLEEVQPTGVITLGKDEYTITTRRVTSRTAEDVYVTLDVKPLPSTPN